MSELIETYPSSPMRDMISAKIGGNQLEGETRAKQVNIRFVCT